MKNVTRKGSLKSRVWAILTVIVMIVSLITPGSKMKRVEAASQGYKVDVKFYEQNGTTPTKPVEPEIQGNIYMLVEAKGGPGDSYTTYAIKRVNFDKNNETTTVNFDKSDFRADKYSGGNFTSSDNNGGQGHYDTGSPNYYSVEKGQIRLYTSDVYYIPMVDTMKEQDYIDQYFTKDGRTTDVAPPEGWAFAGTTKGKNDGTVKFKKAEPVSYEMRFKFTGDGSAISSSNT